MNITSNPESPSDEASSVGSANMSTMAENQNASQFNKYLQGLTEARRIQILTSRSRRGQRNGVTIFQQALKSKNEEIFHITCSYMDRDLKRQVMTLRDDSGNHCLHHVSSQNRQHLVKCLLDNFNPDERSDLITDVNNKGNHCLHLSAYNPSSEVLSFLLKQFKSDDMLWQCIMQPNKEGITVGHTLASSSTATTHKMFTMLCDIARKLNRVREFLIQPNCTMTLLHSLMSADTSDNDNEQHVLGNLKKILAMAEEARCKSDVLWERSRDEDKATPLYHMASLRKNHNISVICDYLLSQKEQDSSMICDYLLSQVDTSQVLDYIMAKNTKYEQNALHIAARHGNVQILHSLVIHLPVSRRQDCFRVRSASGSMPLHLAAGKSAKSVKQLIQYLTIDDRQRIVMLSGDADGNTAMLVALSECNIDAANLLIDKKWVPGHMILPLVCARNRYGWTIHHFACIHSDLAGIVVLDYLGWRPYINLNKTIHHVDTNGNTALHIAALLYRPNVIRLLMSSSIKKCEHRKLLARENKDGLRASQLCDASDHVALKYLQPLVHLGWSDASILGKRSQYLRSLTERKLAELEKANRI